MSQQQQIQEVSDGYPNQNHQVNLKVQSIKKQMSNFLGLLQKSIDAQTLFVSETPKHSQSERKLSTILSASQQNQENEEIQQGAQNQQQIPQNDQKQHETSKVQVFYDQPFQTKQFEPTPTPIILPKKSQTIQIQYPVAPILSARISESSSKKSHRAITGVSDESEKTEKSYKSINSVKVINFEHSLSCLKEFQFALQDKALYQKLKGIIRDYNNYIQILEQRNKNIVVKCERYRVKSEHLCKALQTLKNQQQKMLELFSNNNNKADQVQFFQKEIIKNNEKMAKEIEILRSQNTYLKQLIILANKNYQSLEKKLNQSEQQNIKLENLMKERQKQFIEGNTVLKDIILSMGKQNKSKLDKQLLINCNNKNLERVNTNTNTTSTIKSTANNKQQIEDTYRRMFLKNLKPRKS